MIKRIPSFLKISTRKNKRCYYYIPIPYNRPSLSRDHQTVTIMKHCCYCFDGLWKVKKVKYIILCLNALAKLQNTRRWSRYAALIGNCPSCNDTPWPYQCTKWFVITPFQVVWEAWYSVATTEVSLEKKVDMKCMHAGKRTKKYNKDGNEIVCFYHVTYAC